MSHLPARPVRQVDRIEWMPGTSSLSFRDLGEGIHMVAERTAGVELAEIQLRVRNYKRSAVSTVDNAIYKAFQESQET